MQFCSSKISSANTFQNPIRLPRWRTDTQLPNLVQAARTTGNLQTPVATSFTPCRKISSLTAHTLYQPIHQSPPKYTKNTWPKPKEKSGSPSRLNENKNHKHTVQRKKKEKKIPSQRILIFVDRVRDV